MQAFPDTDSPSSPLDATAVDASAAPAQPHGSVVFTAEPPKQVDFGFQRIPASEKTPAVQKIFDRVAARYDLMNDVMSLGTHRLWKRHMVAHLPPRPTYHHIDVAGGTGDIARLAFDHLHRQGCHGHTTICDLNLAMLRTGTERPHPASLTWVCGNAENLPLPENCADYYTVAFGVRNMTNRAAALQEALRVLKPGGLFLCLEFSQVQHHLLAKLYETYTFKVIPELGALIAKDRPAYAYLVESIARFPHQEAFADELRETGLANVRFHNYMAGIAALHLGWKTRPS